MVCLSALLDASVFSSFFVLFISCILLKARVTLRSGQLFFLQPVILQWVRIGSFRSSSASVSQVAFAIGFSASFCSSLLRARVLDLRSALGCLCSGYISALDFEFGNRRRLVAAPYEKLRYLLLSHAIVPNDT